MIKILQKWHGYVTDIMEDTYWASLKGTIGEKEEIEAEIFKSKTRNADKLSQGTIINWIIYKDKKGKVKSVIKPYLRRWTQEEIDRAKEEAKKWADIFLSH